MAREELSYANISRITFQATVQVVFICLAGFICTKSGLLNSNAQKTISRLNVDLFTPCLVFTKLAPLLSFKKLIDLFVIPIFFAISTAIGYLCSRTTSSLLLLNDAETDFVTAMAAFGNSNSLPVSLTLALSYTLPNLDWEDVENDTPEKIASRGILYLLIFQQLGQILRWSWGYNTLLRKRDPKEIRLVTTGYVEDSLPDEETELIEPRESEEPEDTPIVYEPPLLNRWAKFAYNVSNNRFVARFMGFMNPPLYSMLLAVIVATITPIQQELYVKESFLNHTLASAIRQLGSVSIPLILICLGSNLAPSNDIPPPTRHYNRIVFASLVSRMVLPLLLLLPLIAVAVKYFQISILDDPIFLVVSFILTVSPPAIQLSQICQLNDLFQREMAGVLFWGYVVLTLPTTIAIVVGALEVLEWAEGPGMGTGTVKAIFW
ncbi:hypothetical protein BABINDRAFT_163423 [Babjeviella inositovora NRRL Y-12698]|uniref:Auxin efflux carrier n=1 Tax=Babjeviella inositovora NRRL Y-12698 TaxID=984486 RepID=A0A1E3QL46_9ASCO|nr:uncharacterized protein BABINDRAFT_163423 [Babjeviella inositovora NRRL Y-12698]ODQ77717.1 hypothetical protein BABINDRAFT_163423 [Babjeviella inositovora NRRL Y-12698]